MRCNRYRSDYNVKLSSISVIKAGPLSLSFLTVRKYIFCSLHNSPPPIRTSIIPCLSSHSWKLASFWNRHQRACVCIFSCMPSVHKMNYSCLQLKSRLSWPKVRRKVSTSCVAVENLFPVPSRQGCSICNQNLGPLTGSPLAIASQSSIGNSQKHLLFFWPGLLFLLLKVCFISLILKKNLKKNACCQD